MGDGALLPFYGGFFQVPRSTESSHDHPTRKNMLIAPHQSHEKTLICHERSKAEGRAVLSFTMKKPCRVCSLQARHKVSSWLERIAKPEPPRWIKNNNHQYIIRSYIYPLLWAVVVPIGTCQWLLPLVHWFIAPLIFFKTWKASRPIHREEQKIGLVHGWLRRSSKIFGQWVGHLAAPAIDPFLPEFKNFWSSNWSCGSIVKWWCVCPYRRTNWVCLKIGYIPNYSHLIGIMIINHWV